MHYRVSNITFYDSDALKTRWVRAPNPEHQIVKKLMPEFNSKYLFFLKLSNTHAHAHLKLEVQNKKIHKNLSRNSNGNIVQTISFDHRTNH